MKSSHLFQQTLSRCIRAGGAVVLVALISGCKDSRQQAILELDRRSLAATPDTLEKAVQQEDLKVIGLLRIAGVKAPLPKAGTPSVLHTAAGRMDWLLATQLMDFCDASLLNHAGPEGKVVLEMAVFAGKFALARRLVDSGAKPALATCGANALVLGATSDPAVMDALLAALPEGDAALAPALIRAVAAGDYSRVQRLLDHKAPAAASAEGQGTALEIACRAGGKEIAAVLLKAGARLSDSPEALPSAVMRKDADLARLLLEAGASPGTPVGPQHLDVTPLTMALEGGDLDMVGLMLKHDASPGRCLEHALTKGDSKLIDLLVQHGVALDLPGPDGDPPLVRAAVAGQAGVVQTLLDRGVPRDATGVLGQTAFHMAVIHRKLDVAERFLAAGVKADAPFLKPAPPELLPLFGSEYFARWFQRDEHLTPLMLAAARGDVPQISQLLKAGAKRGAQTRQWHRYPIVFACDNAHIAAAQLLLGRNPDGENEKRHAVISLSRQRVTLFKNDQPIRSARVSTGKKSTPTPSGKYVITDKQIDWESSIYKVPMPFFMRLSCKEIGIHAGVVPGYPASHGCIRMPRGEVQAFFRILRIGDPVTIEP